MRTFPERIIHDKTKKELIILDNSIGIVTNGRFFAGQSENLEKALGRAFPQDTSKQPDFNHIDFVTLTDQVDILATNSAIIRAHISEASPGSFILAANKEYIGIFPDQAELLAQVQTMHNSIIMVSFVSPKKPDTKKGYSLNKTESSLGLDIDVGRLEKGIPLID